MCGRVGRAGRQGVGASYSSYSEGSPKTFPPLVFERGNLLFSSWTRLIRPWMRYYHSRLKANRIPS